MGNLNSGDMREICDTVTQDVLSEVKKNLSEMKPELLTSIIESVEKHLFQKIKNQEQRIQFLEIKCKQQEIRMHKLESQFGEVKKTHSSKISLPNTDEFSKVTVNQKKVDVKKIYGGFKHNGWIYYENKEMADFLYKVREDGTANTQLTDYSIIGLFKVSNGYLCFTDADYKDRKIKLD